MKMAAASERPRYSSICEPALNRRTSSAALRGAHPGAAEPTGAGLLQFRACLPVHALSDPCAARHEILADSPQNPRRLSRRAKFDFLMFEGKTARASRLFTAEQIRAVTAGVFPNNRTAPPFRLPQGSLPKNPPQGPTPILPREPVRVGNQAHELVHLAFVLLVA